MGDGLWSLFWLFSRRKPILQIFMQNQLFMWTMQRRFVDPIKQAMLSSKTKQNEYQGLF